MLTCEGNDLRRIQAKRTLVAGFRRGEAKEFLEQSRASIRRVLFGGLVAENGNWGPAALETAR